MYAIMSTHGSDLGSGGMGRLSAKASHRNGHIHGNLENKKTLTRMGRDGFTQKKHVQASNSTLPGVLR